MSSKDPLDEMMEQIQLLNGLVEEKPKSRSEKVRNILEWAESELGFKRCAVFDDSGLMIENRIQKDDVNHELLGAYGIEFFNSAKNLKENIFQQLSYLNTNSVKIKDVLLETDVGTLIITPLPFPQDMNNEEIYIGFLAILLEKEEIYNLGIIKANLKIIIDALQKELCPQINK